MATLGFAVQAAQAAVTDYNAPLQMVVYNMSNPDSGLDVTLVHTRDSTCFDNGDLAHPLDQDYAAPTTGWFYNAERVVNSNGDCPDHGDASSGVDLMVRQSGGNWYVPSGSPSDYEINFDGKSESFSIRNGLHTWAPLSDGHGLICWHTTVWTQPRQNALPFTRAEIDVYSGPDWGGHCNTAVAPDITPGPPPAPNPPAPSAPMAKGISVGGLSATAVPSWPTAKPVAVVGAVGAHARFAAADDSGSIIDVLSAVGVVCPWYSYPGDTDLCDGYNIGDDGKWTIDNVSTDIKNFEVTNSIGTDDPKQSVATAEISVPATSGSGTLSINKAVATTQTNSNSTQNGGKAGIKIGFKESSKVKVGVDESGFEASQEISGEWNYSTTATDTTSESETRTVAISATALPGYTTTLDVFTTARAANYEYSADLDFGKDATVQAVATPATLALDQSPSSRQPCLAYVIGDASVRNSLMFSGQQLLDAGYSPTEPTEPEAQRAFLASLPDFRAFGSPCPGFPRGYDSEAGFDGTGVGTYENLGYDENGNPVKVMTGCVYQTPFPAAASAARLLHSRLQSPTARPAAGDSPCQDLPVDGGSLKGVTPGDLINDTDGSAGTLVAPARSDDIMGPNAGGTIEANNGADDIVHAGRGPTKEIGGSGTNMLYGGPGNDTLIGGRLGSNYLTAGSGKTLLEETDGNAIMYGGKGADTFEGDNMHGVMVGGTGSSRMIGTGNLTDLQMEGGRGPNTYVLKGTGTPKILQLPNTAPSTVDTDRSLTMPLYVKRGVATGSSSLTLTGSQGTQELVANDARDTLISGPTAELLRGGAGADTIVFNPYNDDTATAGSGPVRYEFTGTPETTPRPAALADPADRTAATITNFNPGKGDRLVLSTAVFGSAITQLRHRFKLVVAADPRPHGPGATLLLSTRTHVLSFDRDGSGPIADKVIAKLPRLDTIRPHWLQIVK